jgi:hypothetical protein
MEQVALKLYNKIGLIPKQVIPSINRCETVTCMAPSTYVEI